MSGAHSLGSNPTFEDFLGKAVSLLSEDIRIPLVTIVGGALSAIPIVGVFLTILVFGAAHILAQRSLGWSVETSGALLAPFVYLLLGSVIAGIGILIGLVFLILPGIYLAVRFSLLVPAIMVDERGPVEGIGESWERSEGNVLTIFGFQLAVLIGATLVLAPIVLSLGLDAFVSPADPLAQLAIGIVSGAFGAVTVGGNVLMYRAFGAQTQGDSERETRTNDSQW